MSRSARRALVPCALMTIVIMVLIVTPARAALGSVSADWPSAKLSRGSTVSVTGRVSGQAPGDGVLLQQKVLGGWRNISKDALDSQRNYQLSIPTWWLGQRSYRVVTTDCRTSRTSALRAGPGPSRSCPPTTLPASSRSSSTPPRSYARWNPCRTIGYRVNARQATSGAVTDVKGAFQRLSQATGFHFVYRGTTTGIPQNGGNSWYPSGTQIVVAWARPSQSSMLRLYPNAVAVGSAITSGGYANGDGCRSAGSSGAPSWSTPTRSTAAGSAPATPAATSCSTSSATPWAWATPARPSRSCTPGSPAGRPGSARATSTASSAAAPSWAASGRRSTAPSADSGALADHRDALSPRTAYSMQRCTPSRRPCPHAAGPQ